MLSRGKGHSQGWIGPEKEKKRKGESQTADVSQEEGGEVLETLPVSLRDLYFRSHLLAPRNSVVFSPIQPRRVYRRGSAMVAVTDAATRGATKGISESKLSVLQPITPLYTRVP